MQVIDRSIDGKEFKNPVDARVRAVIDHRMAALISLLPAAEPWQTGIINREIQELKILMKELA